MVMAFTLLSTAQKVSSLNSNKVAKRSSPAHQNTQPRAAPPFRRGHVGVGRMDITTYVSMYLVAAVGISKLAKKGDSISQFQKTA